MQSNTYPAKISSQGQITLPKELRQKLRVSKGQIVYLGVNKGSLHVDTEPPIMKYYGALQPKPGRASAIEAVREARARHREKIAKAFKV